jgi:hypothetical protein
MSDVPRDDDPPPDGTVERYGHDVVRLVPEEWVIDVADEPADDEFHLELSTDGDFRFRSGSLVTALQRNLSHVDLIPTPAGMAEAAADDAVRQSAESRHLTVDAPTQVVPGDPFAVHVQLTVDARGPVSEPMRLFVIPEETGRVVTVDLRASDNLAPASGTTRQVTVLRGADSDFARFELTATREGKATVDVRAFTDQQFIGAAHVEMMVQADAQGGQQRIAVPSIITANDKRGLTLEIRLDEDKTYYEFQIRGDSFTEPPMRGRFGDLDLAARGLQQQLNELATARNVKYSDLAVQTMLSNQGADLFARLPPAVQSRLVESIGAAERLSIVLSDNDPMPWELVYVTKGPTPGFLSDLFLMTRWPYGASPPLDVGHGERCYVLPPDPPTAAVSEIAAVTQRIGAGKRLSTVNDLLAELGGRQFGLLHFAAHNVPNFSSPSASAILLDQPFTQSLVGRTLEGALTQCRPLVFLNACSSNTPTPSLADTGAEGWATRFLLIGAGGFIGTLWEIRDGSAASFADAFYAHLANRAPLGVAFREARTAIRKDGDPTWLAYTLYAHPAALYGGEKP